MEWSTVMLDDEQALILKFYSFSKIVRWIFNGIKNLCVIEIFCFQKMT